MQVSEKLRSETIHFQDCNFRVIPVSLKHRFINSGQNVFQFQIYLWQFLSKKNCLREFIHDCT